MDEQRMTFYKKFEGKNGEILEIKFEGICSNSLEVEKSFGVLEKIGQNFQYGNELLDYVQYSRYILRKFKEELLSFTYGDKEGNFESVCYDHQKISSYTCKFRVYASGRIWTELRFISGIDDDLQISMSGFEGASFNEQKKALEKYRQIIQRLHDLKYCESFSPTFSDGLIEMYHLFYQETPDFGREECQIKAYAMKAILVEFGVISRTFHSQFASLSEPDQIGIGTLLLFDFDDKLEMPIETRTQRDMSLLSPFGEIEKYSPKDYYKPEWQTIIRLIGSVVLEEMEKASDPIVFLKTISKCLWDYDYEFYSKSRLKNHESPVSRELELTASLLKKIRKVLIPQIISDISQKLENVYNYDEVLKVYDQYFDVSSPYHDKFGFKTISPQHPDELSSDEEYAFVCDMNYMIGQVVKRLEKNYKDFHFYIH